MIHLSNPSYFDMTVGDPPAAPALTTAKIYPDRLRSNLSYLRELAGTARVMAVVKANAYSHGIDHVVPVLQDEGVDRFAVATPAEGVELRHLGVTGEILVMGRVLPEAIPACCAHDLSLAVSSIEEIEPISRRLDAAPLDIHVNVDTGMGRLGVSVEEAPELVARLSDRSDIRVRGLWSHFATADDPDSPVVQRQWKRFIRLADRLEAAGHLPEIHVANSGALLYHRQVIDRPCGVVRTGISLYGYGPNPEIPTDNRLEPILDLCSRVVHVKTISDGTPVSYTHTWQAPQRTRVATIAAGYGDGYRRALSNRAQVRINDSRYPVVGNVCMDMFMVDIGPPQTSDHQQPVAVGDRALLFGAKGPTARDLANWSDTIPYEILCGISQRVSRCTAARD